MVRFLPLALHFDIKSRVIASRVVSTTGYMPTAEMSHKPLGHATLSTNEGPLVSLPVWCECGEIVTFVGETRCENCYANDQQKYSGKPTRVDTPHLSRKQEDESELRRTQVKQLFQGGGTNVRVLQTAPRPV